MGRKSRGAVGEYGLRMDPTAFDVKGDENLEATAQEMHLPAVTMLQSITRSSRRKDLLPRTSKSPRSHKQSCRKIQSDRKPHLIIIHPTTKRKKKTPTENSATPFLQHSQSPSTPKCRINTRTGRKNERVQKQTMLSISFGQPFPRNNERHKADCGSIAELEVERMDKRLESSRVRTVSKICSCPLLPGASIAKDTEFCIAVTIAGGMTAGTFIKKK